MTNKYRWTLATTGIVGGLIALTALSTLLLRIPIPATTGYFNIGDVFVIFSGLWLGPLAGALVGAIGPSIADAIGFPVYIPATFATKGMEGLVVGLIASMGGQRNIKIKVVAAFCGGVTVVVGYFLFQAFIYPAVGNTIPAFAITDIGAAMVELVPNMVQGLVGALGGLALWRAVSGYDRNK